MQMRQKLSRFAQSKLIKFKICFSAGALKSQKLTLNCFEPIENIALNPLNYLVVTGGNGRNGIYRFLVLNNLCFTNEIISTWNTLIMEITAKTVSVCQGFNS